METSDFNSGKMWRRRWFWIGLMSLFAAAGLMLWQMQDSRFWDGHYIGDIGLRRVAYSLFFSFIFAFTLCALVLSAWRHWPANRRARVFLVSLSLVLAALACLRPMPQGYIGWSHFVFAELIWSAVILTGLLFLGSIWHGLRWLMRWRILRWGFYALLALIVLALVYRIEEDWRGTRAWKDYRREWEAKGEKFDFSALIPPPVPDDQNFAMAPIVADSLAGRWVDTNQERPPVSDIRPDPLMMRLHRDNYDDTNAIIGKWELGRSTDLKAWQAYFRARFVTNSYVTPYTTSGLPPPGTNDDIPPVEITVLASNEFPICDHEQAPAADVLLALTRYAATLAELADAAQRPRVRFPIAYETEDPAKILLPHFADLKACAEVLQLRACAKLDAGDTAGALADVNMIFRLADILNHEQFLIASVVRLRVLTMALQPVWEGLKSQRWNDAQLQELGQMLAANDLVSGFDVTVRAERAWTIAEIEYWRRHRAQSGFCLMAALGEEVPDSVKRVGQLLADLPEPLKEICDHALEAVPDSRFGSWLTKLPPNGWYEWNKVEAASYFQQLLSIADWTNHVVSCQKAQAISPAYVVGNRLSPQNCLLYLLSPEHETLALRCAAAQNGLDMARLACVLERYRLKHGNYPAELNALVPDFVATIPPDVVNGQPLHYRRTDGGRCQLYSIGWNGTDDGGLSGDDGRGRYNPKFGDWVWQYPEK